MRSDIDFSIYKKDSCVKNFFSVEKLSEKSITDAAKNSTEKLDILLGEKVELSPGIYPAYFSPSAVNEMISMFNWHGIQGKAFAEKQSVFMDLFNGDKYLSDKFNLRENFSLKLAPRFNEESELSDEVIEIISKGKLSSPLVNSTTEIITA